MADEQRRPSAARNTSRALTLLFVAAQLGCTNNDSKHAPGSSEKKVVPRVFKNEDGRPIKNACEAVLGRTFRSVASLGGGRPRADGKPRGPHHWTVHFETTTHFFENKKDYRTGGYYACSGWGLVDGSGRKLGSFDPAARWLLFKGNAYTPVGRPQGRARTPR